MTPIVLRALLRRHDPGDRLGVRDERAEVLNACVLVNGMMAADVELVLAARTGLDTAPLRFDKLRGTIDGALAGSSRTPTCSRAPSCPGSHSVSLWDHLLLLYDLRPLGDYPRLRAIVAALDALPEIGASRPA